MGIFRGIMVVSKDKYQFDRGQTPERITTMKNINTLKNAINPNNLGYSKGHTNLFDDGKTYEYFKLEEDGYVYVLCIDTNRATRYNGEGQNGKRISMDAYLEARETLEREAEFKEIMEEAEESAKTEEAKEIADLYCRHPEGTDLQSPAILNEHGCVDCSKCNVQNCVHRDCMRRNPTDKGGLAECPRLKVKAEEPKHEMFTTNPITGVTYYHGEDPDAKQPKAKKVRKSKDAFHMSLAVPGLTLTAKQTTFLLHLSDTNFWENGLDSVIWVDCLCDDIGGEFAGKPMTVGAMISTLCEKGLGTRATERREGRKCTSFALTELGKKVAAEVGLK